MFNKIKNQILKLIFISMWWRNSEKACASAELKAFNTVFEGESKIIFKEFWSEWEWLVKLIAIVIGILYGAIKFILLINL
ncbi:MAG: hypothetical protein CVU35_04805 [Betaproteobacteria bacterium HGW-Betaproteobacteria-8]|nr:MAG: hypothetical protein CVU35_04805 [Betaproteobacteria bacterium HGW-Betaproteobacteria-8]